ncbi:MAG: hypothetical protein LAP87_29575 [Acidobacteriia bacterium]|nr:hypothetical protein [Terriglobia bacterium]
MMRSFRILVLLVALAAVVLCQRPQMAAVVAGKQTLVGRAAMAVAMDMASIPGYNFRPDVENRLREGGIAILRPTEDPPTYPLLRVGIDAAIVQKLQPPQLNYHVALEFIQLIPLGDGKYLKATTWSSSHSALTPWNGILSGPQAVGEIQKDVMSLLDGFVEDWREVNGQTRPQSGSPPAVSGRFDGTWRGTYACSGGLGGGQTVWVIREVKAGVIQVDEQWTHFITGRNVYSGTIAGRNLNVRTSNMGGYDVKLTLADDNVTLRGTYAGHPNHCDTINLRKSQ